MQKNILGVSTTFPDDMAEEEAQCYVVDEIQVFQLKNKKVATVNIEIDGEEVVVEAREKSPIVRLARITGYLSNIKNFGDHKQAELTDRVKHL